MKQPPDTRPESRPARQQARLDGDGLSALARRIKAWGRELGFQQLGICDTDLEAHERCLDAWLRDGFHGEMEYMARHGTRRSRPAELVPGTLRVISARMDYLRAEARPAAELTAPHPVEEDTLPLTGPAAPTAAAPAAGRCRCPGRGPCRCRCLCR